MAATNATADAAIPRMSCVVRRPSVGRAAVAGAVYAAGTGAANPATVAGRGAGGASANTVTGAAAENV